MGLSVELYDILECTDGVWWPIGRVAELWRLMDLDLEAFKNGLDI
jgi:hypothetical protein